MMKYKRCKTCGVIYPADLFDKGTNEFGVRMIPLKNCLYCKAHEDLGTFELIELELNTASQSGGK